MRASRESWRAVDGERGTYRMQRPSVMEGHVAIKGKCRYVEWEKESIWI